MKKILIASIITLLSFSVDAQTSILSRSISILKDEGYTIVENKYADLVQGGTTYMYRTFAKGVTYTITGFSDDRDVKDLDIYIYFEDGELYKKDVLTDSKPIVTFTPTSTRTMKIVLKNYASDDPDF